MTVMPGGVDIHTHIAGGEVNTGENNSSRRPRKRHRTQKPPNPSRHRLLHSIHFHYRLPLLTYGLHNRDEPINGTLEAKHTHEELNDIPYSTKPLIHFSATGGSSSRTCRKATLKDALRHVAWMLDTTKGYAIKIVNPGGLESWGFGHNVHS